MLTRKFLIAPHGLRRSAIMRPALHFRPIAYIQYSSGLQSVTQPSFWASLVPKPLRRTSSPSKKVASAKSKGWNPATFYIVIFLLIGSMSIQMIALRNSFAAFSRRADAKIDLLREVIERVQKGEDVDVEGLLGTGDLEKEKEWEEVLKEFESEEALWTESRRKKPRRSHEARENTAPAANDSGNSDVTNGTVESTAARPKSKSTAPSGFF